MYKEYETCQFVIRFRFRIRMGIIIEMLRLESIAVLVFILHFIPVLISFTDLIGTLNLATQRLHKLGHFVSTGVLMFLSLVGLVIVLAILTPERSLL